MTPARAGFALVVAGIVIVAACTPALIGTPSPGTQAPSPTASPSPPPSASPIPGKLECPGSDLTPGRPPGPAVSEQAENWAGYVIFKSSARLTCVVGSWTQPAVVCPATGSATVAIWVGLDGVKDPRVGVDSSATLEQIGTQAACDGGKHSNFAWYQVIPHDQFSVPISTITVAPGDRIWAIVRFDKETVTLRILDATSGGSFTLDEPLADAPRLTAEWVVEAPAVGCPSNCRIAALPRFARVVFTDAFASAGSQRGSISDDTWTHDALDLVRSGIERASVSRLTSGGTSFSVTWRHS